MAEKDITGRAVERVGEMLVRLKENFQKAVPLGPSQVRFTPDEMRRFMKDAPDDVMAQLVKTLGPELAARLSQAPSDEDLVDNTFKG